MTPTAPRDRRPDRPAGPTRRGLLACAWVALALGATARPAEARWQGAPARQVVVFGVHAVPGSTEMDPKIAPVVQAQLRRLRPGHGFRLLEIKGERVTAGKTVRCDLGDGFEAAAKLTTPADRNGKITMHFDLTLAGTSQFQTVVVTPPDQFNFIDKALPNGNRLLIGVGAR